MFKKLRTALNRDMLKSSKNNFVLTDSTDNVLTYLEPKTVKKTRVLLRTSVKVSRSRSKRLMRRSLKFKRSGSRKSTSELAIQKYLMNQR